MSSSFRLVYWIRLWYHRAYLSVLQAPLYLWTLWCYVSVFFVKIILTSLYLVEGLAWWDWPFTWWTDQLLYFSALTHCWWVIWPVKIVPNMTYNVFCGTLNPQCIDTVGWVIWPVKIVPNMTYNVFGGTLNPTLLHPLSIHVTFTAIVPGAYPGETKMCKNVLEWRTIEFTG